MQIDRRFEIIYLLLNKTYKTVKDLAFHFEVSTRTIYRDIEALSIMGIPIYSNRGKGGGVFLLDNFIFDKSFLTEKEQRDVLSSLQSLSVTNYPELKNVIMKLNALFNKDISNWIDVDFSDWSNNSNERFNIIRNSIFNKEIICFDYHGTNGKKTSRRVEPVQLKYKNKSWYLYGFCLDKNEFRLFKLNRIRNFKLSGDFFKEREKEAFDFKKNRGDDFNHVTIKLEIDKYLAYRVYDEFEEEQVKLNEEGNFIVTVSFVEDEWVYGYILSFGYNAKVLEPEHIRKIIIQKLKKTLENYL